MDKEIFVKKMKVSGILFKYDVPINEGKIIGTFIEELEQQCKKQKEVFDKVINYIVKETKSMPTNGCKIRLIEILDILNEVSE